MAKNNEIIVVATPHSGNPNGSWKAKLSRMANCKYVVQEEHGQVKEVFKLVGGVHRTRKDKRRIDFDNLISASPYIQRKYQHMDVSRKKGESNPVRYRAAL